MADSWKENAMKIGAIIRNGAARFSELIPLHTSWINFARKCGLRHQEEGTAPFPACLEQNGMFVISPDDFNFLTSTISQQAEEIEALEYRIKTLLRP